MKKNEFNAIGIESQLDWQRIAKLLKIGLFASCLVLIGDLLLGHGQPAAGTKGLEKLLSAYSGKKDSVYVWAGVLGLLGMFLEGLSYFGIFLLYMIATQISAFAKGMTPYPHWCWIFNMGFGILLAVLVYLLFGKYAWGNAVSAAGISIGNIWQFVGLLVVMKKRGLD